MRDFILKKYAQLLEALQDWGFFFVPFKEFLEKPINSLIILRHDVDILIDERRSLNDERIIIKLRRI
ncbi:MAG: hypothetical protein ISS18_16275 [Bacteroidales bacterium]|nr:hypothetical protein [Bacteroidales bacterium]